MTRAGFFVQFTHGADEREKNTEKQYKIKWAGVEGNHIMQSFYTLPFEILINGSAERLLISL